MLVIWLYALFQDDHLLKILESISKWAYKKGMVEDELACLQSIMVKLVSHFKDLEDIIALVFFSLNFYSLYLQSCHLTCHRVRMKYLRSSRLVVISVNVYIETNN